MADQGRRATYLELAIRAARAHRDGLLDDARRHRLYGDHMMAGVLETEAKGMTLALGMIQAGVERDVAARIGREPHRAAQLEKAEETTPDGPEGLRATIPIGPTRGRS